MDEPARSPVSLPPISSALVAPLAVARRELAEVASRPLPFVGGVFGSLLGCAALTAALLWMPSSAAAEEETFTVEFVPASLVSAGEVDGVVSEQPAEPEAEPTEEPPEAEAPATREPVEDSPGDSVSESANVPQPEPPKPEPPKPRPELTPEPPKPAPIPTPAPPPPGVDSKSPIQSPDSWSELVRDGDPWAAAVLAALRSMQVPAFAGKIEAGQPYAFRMRVCKNGSVEKVLRKKSTGDANLDATLAHEISRLKLPPMPANISAGMPASCVTLGYTFAWTVSGVG